MNQIWLNIFMVMIGGSIAKYAVVNAMIWVAIDVGVLGICYMILKRYPYMDMKKNMTFLGGYTLINVLVDLGMLTGMVANLSLLALVGWLVYEKRRGA